MKVSLCVGNYASNPYCFEGLDLRVYCAEELCFCLKENAFLLDTDIMADRLLEWLERECGLVQLSKELYVLVHKKGSLSSFVSRILEYVGFYDAETIRSVEQTLKRGAGLNVLEKRKLRIDHLVEQKKFQAAVAEYDALLSVWEEGSERGEKPGAGLYAGLLHNKGTALAGMMRYQDAARAFQEAYEADADSGSLLCFLAAKRMELSDREYVDFMAGLPEYYEISLQLEQKVEQLNTQWEQETDYLRLMQRKELRKEDERSYLEENRRVVQALKESYRGMAG